MMVSHREMEVEEVEGARGLNKSRSGRSKGSEFF